MYIKRTIASELREVSQEFPVVAIVGPRQSGKTTLAQFEFPDHRYVSLEDLDIRSLAHEDPRAFLHDFPSKVGLILDEIQHAPHLLSYMQTIVDREKKMGFFIVTGSQNFLVDEAITQSLAGRMAVLTLLPLSLAELEMSKLIPSQIEAAVYNGFYPRAYAEKISVERLYNNYIRLYVERDVRQIKNVYDLNTFQKFMKLCAGRIGQVLNLTSLGNDCGINHSTAKAWISLLESSYIIFLLYPHYTNFGKRLIKAPKLYFVDTGVACSLLNIPSFEDLVTHYLRGGLVESCIISDFLKQQYNRGKNASLYFWRDQVGHEIDCIIDTSKGPIPVEIKSAQTIAQSFFKEIKYWQALNGSSNGYVVYGGKENQRWPDARVVGWQSAGSLIQQLLVESGN